MPGSEVTLSAVFSVKDSGDDADTSGMDLTSSEWDGKSIDVSWYMGHEKDTSYTLSSAAQLAGVAALVNGRVNDDCIVYTGDKVYTASEWNESEYVFDGMGVAVECHEATLAYNYGITRFEGKTIYLTSDLDMSKSNWMPIGGAYLMTDENNTTKVSSSFCGVFDGKGHNVTILCDRHCSTLFGDSSGIGFIGRLGVHDSDDESLRPSGAAVRNIAVYGSVKGNRSVGGIVGKIGKTANTAVIENCANFSTVYGTDAKGTGGVVGAGWNDGKVLNCYNAGSVTHTMASNANGGISGSNEVPLINCYNIGKVTANGTSAAIATENGSRTYTNCYWLENSGDVGVYDINSEGVTEKSASEMKTDSFVNMLGNAYAKDIRNINNGYPVLSWQAERYTSTDPGTGAETAVDTSWYNTANKEFTLNTAAQLLGFAEIVNGTADGIAKDNFAGKTVKLGGDIALDADGKYTLATGTFGASGYPMPDVTYYTVNENANIWTPIGMSSTEPTSNIGAGDGNAFAGTFDGQGHTVSGVYTDSSKTVQGLFGVVTGTVKSVTVSGCITGKFIVGGIAADVRNGGSVSDCVNNAVVYADGGQTADSGKENGISRGGAVGGIVGNALGTASVVNNVNNGTVVCTNTSKGGRVGGIIGLIDGAAYKVDVEKNINNADIYGYQYVGGIVGFNNSKVSPINACANKGNIYGYSSGSTYIGGMQQRYHKLLQHRRLQDHK